MRVSLVMRNGLLVVTLSSAEYTSNNSVAGLPASMNAIEKSRLRTQNDL